MTIPEAAQAAKIPEGTIRRWLSEGRLVRHGDRKPYRVNFLEVDALIRTLRETRLPRA